MAPRACKAAGAVFAPFSQNAPAETLENLSGFFLGFPGPAPFWKRESVPLPPHKIPCGCGIAEEAAPFLLWLP